jgi:hypothetical protein
MSIGSPYQLSCFSDGVRVEGVVDIDEHVAVVDLAGVDGDRLVGREAGRLAGAQVEPRAVQPTLDRAPVDLTLGERDVGVRAGVVDRIDVPEVRERLQAALEDELATAERATESGA